MSLIRRILRYETSQRNRLPAGNSYEALLVPCIAPLSSEVRLILLLSEAVERLGYVPLNRGRIYFHERQSLMTISNYCDRARKRPIWSVEGLPYIQDRSDVKGIHGYGSFVGG